MSSMLAATLFIACPLIGALVAISGQYSRPWQILFGAVVGVAGADVIFRVWSKRAIGLAMRGEAMGVTVWSIDIDWSGRLAWNGALLVIALIVGGGVLLVRQFVARPN